MSYNNLLVSSNSDTDESIESSGKCAETTDKVGRSVKKTERCRASLYEGMLDDEEVDEEVFVDVQDTASWTKHIDGQNSSFCGFNEPTDWPSDSSTVDGDVNAENNLDLKSNSSLPDTSANDLSSVMSDDKNGHEELQRKLSVTGASGQNLTRVEIDIVNASEVSIDMQSKILSVSANGSNENDRNQANVGPAFELQSNNSETTISMQTNISIATRSDDSELQSNCSDAGVSLNTLSSDRSEENASFQSDQENANSLKSDDSKASLTVNLPGSIRSEESFSAETSPDFGVDLLLEECKTSVATEERPIDDSEEKKSLEVESEFGVEECKGSISLILKSKEGDIKIASEDHDADCPLFRPATHMAAENIPEKLNSDFGNASDLKNEIIENVSGASGEISCQKLESESEAVVRLRTEEFMRDEATRHPPSENDAKTVGPVVENVQFTLDLNTSIATDGLSAETPGGNTNGTPYYVAKNDVTQDNDSSIDAGQIGAEKIGSDPQPLAEMPETEDKTLEMSTMLKIVDSPTQLTTKSLDNLLSDSDNQEIPEEVHNSKSFGIPNKKSSKNRSACSLVKHNNSVEILRTKDSDEGTETEGEDDADIGYRFANKSSSSLGKHRDSVELLCGKRFDSGSSIQAGKLSFLNSATDDDDEDGAAYQSRSGLLKIRDSVEIIGMGGDDVEIGDVTFESSFHHSPRSILKINRPRSKENACSNTRLVSWKDTTVETELESNFPDDVKEMGSELSVENRRTENAPVDGKIEANALPVGAKKKLSKKPPRPKVGNLIKLFSSNKKIAFVDSDSEVQSECHNENCVAENVQNEAQNEVVSNEGDAEEIKKTFNFWQKVCGTAEDKPDDQLKQSSNNEHKITYDPDNLNIVIIEKSDAVPADATGVGNVSKCSADGATVPKIPVKFVEKFEGTTTVPNPLFKKFPLPVENVFVKDRVSVLERSTNGEEDGGQVKNSTENP